MSEIQTRGVEDMRGLGGIKWNKFDDDVIPAWVADMDIRPADCVTEAVATLARSGDFGYSRRAAEQLPEVFSAWQLDHHGWSIDPGEVRTFCDVLHAIDVALWLHTEPGDGIVLLTPIYPPFLKAVHSSGRRLVDVPLDTDGWRLNPDRLRAAIDDRTSAILICNPHNPTGRAFDVDELTALAEVVIEHDLLLLSDEVWADLLHPGVQHRPVADLGSEIASRTVTISAASKAFNMAGLRCAVAHLGHREIAAKIEALPGHLLGAVGTPGAEASLAAWTKGEDWLSAVRGHLTDRRDQLARRLAADLPTVGFQSPEATYLAWLDFRALGLGDDPSDRLLSMAGVGLSPGSDFGPLGDGFARLNFATSEDILDQILDRIVAAIKA